MDAFEPPSVSLLLFGFLGGMCALGSLLAVVVYLRDGGKAEPDWLELAKAYPAGRRPPEGVVVQGCGANVGRSTYQGALVVTFAREGIHVAAGPLLPPERAYPPVLLPWSGVRSATKKETSFQQQGVIEFQNNDRWVLTLFVPNPAGGRSYAADGPSDFSREGSR